MSTGSIPQPDHIAELQAAVVEQTVNWVAFPDRPEAHAVGVQDGHGYGVMDAPTLAVRLMTGGEITEQEREGIASLLIAGAVAMHTITGINPNDFPDPVDKMLTYGEQAAAWKHVREPLELLLDGAA